MYSALDTANILTGHAHDLKTKGIIAVGVYCRTDRTPLEEVQGLQSVGIKLWSTFEKGNPTTPDYFTADQAKIDSELFLTWAKLVNQPAGNAVFPCADYDSNPSDIATYVELFHNLVKAEGYLMGLYANGISCKYFKNAGLIHYTWLTQSRGFSGYEDWLPHADIVQHDSGTILGFDVDFDTIVNQAVLW